MPLTTFMEEGIVIITGNPKEQILSQIISFYGVTSENVWGGIRQD